MATLITGISLVVGFVLWEDHLCRQTTFPPLMRVNIWTRAQGKFAAIQIIQFLEMSSFMSWMLWVQLYYQTYKVSSYANAGQSAYDIKPKRIIHHWRR